MSEVIDAPGADIEARQQAWLAQAGRSMALVEQALADETFLKQNPHIKELNNAISLFSVLISMKSGDRQEERAEETRASLWNVIMTRLGTQDIPARRLTGPLADGSERPRTLAQDAHLFPGTDLVRTLASTISTSSTTFNSRADFDSVVKEIYPLIEADIKRQEREALQAADPLRDQKLDEGYKDPLEGQTLLDTEEEIAAAKTANQRRALELCVNAMSDETFRTQNPGFVRVMDGIEAFARSRTSPGDHALREKYESELCHFFLTRNNKIPMEQGLAALVTPGIEAAMTQAIRKLEADIPAPAPVPSTALTHATAPVRTGSKRSQARANEARGDNRVPDVEITLRSERQEANVLECVRRFPQLVGRETAVQDTARNQKARLFINGMISDDGFRDARSDIFVLAQKIEAYACDIADSDNGKARPGSEDNTYLARRRDFIATFWSALLLDKRDGGFLLPTPKQTALALEFLEAPARAVKPVVNEAGSIIGYESRGPGSPIEKLRGSLGAFQTRHAAMDSMGHRAAKLPAISEQEPETVIEDAAAPSENEGAAVPEDAVVAEAAPQGVLAAEGPASSVESRGERNRRLAVGVENLIRTQRAGNVTPLFRPKAGDDASRKPAAETFGDVTRTFARAAALVAAFGLGFLTGTTPSTPDTAAAPDKNPGMMSKVAHYFRSLAASTPVTTAYAIRQGQEKREPGIEPTMK